MNAAYFLTCDQLSASWQDYLDTATDCTNYIQFLGSAFHPGMEKYWNFPCQLWPCLDSNYELFSERVNTFKPEKQILG